MRWITLSPQAIENIEMGTFLLVARPDGKSWSGILDGKSKSSFILRNANNRTELHFALNPTASYIVVAPPKWEIKFGQPRLI